MYFEAIIIALLGLAVLWLVVRERRLKRRFEADAKQLRSEIARLDRTSETERRRRKLSEQLLEELKDAFLVVDGDLRIRFANRAARERFAVDAPAGRLLIEVCVEHHIVRLVDEALRQGALAHDEIGLSDLLFDVSAAPVAQTFAGADGAWILLRDITAQRETEQMRRDFVANAAHELRTPLSIIGGYLEMFDTADWMPVQGQRPVEKMRRHGERLSRLVDDMLTVSRLESEPGLLRREPFRIVDCAADAVEYLQPLIDERKASVTLEFPSPEASIDGDRFYWDQIFLNLLENALKHNERPGLKLAIRHRASDSGDTIEVSDNGVGIPKRDLPHVFERFYRVVKHRSQEVPGTGLGLSIVKRAVAAHGGEIGVRSVPGGETTFTMTLPASGA